MISEKIIEAVIKVAKPADKDMMLTAFIVKLGGDYNYNDDKVNHCLETLLDETKLVGPADINMDYINKNFNTYIYKSENYIIKDIKLKSIDNIEGVVSVSYKAKEKINEYTDGVDFVYQVINISFIDNPQVLKNS